MVDDISVEELAQWLADGREFTLLDVREQDEVQTASIEGARWIPMGEIPTRAAELPKGRAVAVLCHHGVRSARVAQFLALQGFSKVVSVDGGIDAYAEKIDTKIPRY